MNHQILMKQLILHEGKRNKVYTDTVGKISIGVGRNLTDRGLDDAEVFTLLRNDIQICEKNLDDFFPWWRDHSEVRQHVMLDMCFNLGISRLKLFTKTLGSIRDGNYSLAATQMLQSKWAKQVGFRATRLSLMMQNDIFPEEIK